MLQVIKVAPMLIPYLIKYGPRLPHLISELRSVDDDGWQKEDIDEVIACLQDFIR